MQQLERVGDLAGDGAGQPAGHDVQMAAVEDLQRHGLQQHQRHQDHQQAAAEQRARQERLDPGADVRLRMNSSAHRQAPGFSM